MIKKNLRRFQWLFTIGVVCNLIFFSCAYDNREELVKENVCEADSLTISFSQHIQPLLASNCGGCHSGNSPQAGVRMIGYSEVIKYVNNGKLLGVITHTNGFPPMPLNAPKLPECEIKKVQKWAGEGAPNN